MFLLHFGRPTLRGAVEFILSARQSFALPTALTQASSRVAHGRTAISQTNSRAQKPDWLSISFCRARRRCGQARFRNARRRVGSDRWHRDKRKRDGARQKVPVRDDPARCKSRSARQNTPLLGCVNNSSGYRQRYFATPLRSACAASIFG